MFKRILAGILSTVIVFSSLSPAVNAVEMTEIVQEEVTTEDKVVEETVEVEATEVEVELGPEQELQPEPEEETEKVVEEILAVEEVTEVVAYETGTEGERTVVKEGECGENIAWAFYNDCTLEISGNGAVDLGVEDVYYNDYPWYSLSSKIVKVVFNEGITSIGAYAFYNYDGLSSIELSDSLTNIGAYAFTYCDELSSIEFSNSLISLGGHAFAYCDGLSSIKFPDSLTSIGYKAFAGCTGLSSVEFSNSLISIGMYAFEDCDGLSSIKFPDSLTSIEDKAFYDCNLLNHVVLPKSLTSIGEYAFSSEYLESVQYTGTWEEWNTLKFSSDTRCGIDDCEVTTFYEFSYKPNGDNTVMITGAAVGGIGGIVQIPETIEGYTVTAIAEKAFANNQTIQILDIPSSVTVIEKQAFYNAALRKLTLHEGLQRIEDNAFYNALGYWGSDTNYEMKELVLPEGLQTIGQSAFKGSRMNGEITVPSSVTSIGESAFDIDDEILYKGSSQQWIDIHNADTNNYPPRNKVTFGKNGAGFIKKIEEDNSISYRLFSWAGAEGSITVLSEFRGMPVTGIDSFVFQENTRITSVVIPESIKSIDWSAFSGCSNLEKVEINATISSIPSSMFYECINLKEVYLPHTITSINDNAFYQCNSLEKIHYDSEYNWDKVSVSSGNGAIGYAKIEFLHDWGYEFVEEWNGSQRYLASCRIVGKKEIGKELNIPNDFHGIPVKYIGYEDYNIAEGLFENNQVIENVTLPENIESVYKNTFKNCQNLKKVVLPREMEYIGESAFKGCINLENVVLPKIEDYVGESAFEDCTGITIIDISQISDLGSKAFKGCTSLKEIIFPGEMDGPATSVFEGCISLESVTIPKNVNLGSKMFKDCTGLKKISFAKDYDGITGCYIFAGCTSVNEIEMPMNGLGWWSCSSCSDMDREEYYESKFEGVPRTAKIKIVKDYSSDYHIMEDIGFKNLIPSIVLREITLPKSVSVELGKSKLVSVTKVPSNANETLELEWSSADDSVAQVDKNGKITGLKMGNVQIIVKDKISGKTARTTVQVVLPAKSKITVKTDPVIDTIGLQTGQSVTMQIFATELGTEESLNPALFTFTSSDDSIATVDENGVITSVYNGTKSLNVKITAALKNDSAARKVYLSVKTIPVQVETLGYYLSEEFEAIGDTYVVPKSKVKDADYQIQVYAQPLSATEELLTPTLKWTTSNSKVATVSKDGLVTVKKNADGIAKITATVNDLKKVSVSFEIDVRDYNPRLAANTVTLNTNTFDGAQVQMYPVYGTDITAVRLEGNDSYSFDVNYIPEDGIHTLNVVADGIVKNGTYKLTLISTIEGIGEYEQSFNVKVANSVPAITVKQKAAFNLFYLGSEAVVSVTAKNAVVSNVELSDTETFKGEFNKDTQELVISYDDKDSILDKKATITVMLKDYKNPITKTFNINAKETKPTLAVSRKSTSLSALSGEGVPLQITNKALNKLIDWDEDKCNVRVADTSIAYVTTTHEGTDLTIQPILDENKFANGKTSHSAKLEIQGENWLKPIVVTHTISIVTKNPTIKASQSTLTLNSLFGNTVETTIVPSLSNCPEPYAYEFKAAKELEDYKKIKLEVQEGWNLKASFEDPDDLPAKGSYKYDVLAQIDGVEEPVKTTVTVKVAESKPKVTLEKTSVTLNKMIADQIDFAAKITAGYEIADMFISNADGNVLNEDQLAVTFNRETGRVSVEILNENVENKTYKYQLTPIVKMDGIEKEEKLNSLVLNVKVYGNNASISAAGKGGIDLVTRESGIIYTITGGKNFNYHVNDVCVEETKLVGNDAELFEIEVLEANAKGQPQIMVKAKQYVDFSTAVTYKYKLAVKINHLEKEIESAEFKIKAKQSALSLKAQGDLIVYQSVKNGKISIEVVKPVDAKVKEMQILETKATTVPKDALSYELEKKADGSYVLNYQVINPEKLKANAGYKLSLAVTQEGNALNKTAQTFTITLKVKR